MDATRRVALVAMLCLGVAAGLAETDDLIAQESSAAVAANISHGDADAWSHNRTKYSSRIVSRLLATTDIPFGLKLRGEATDRTTEKVLDFRITDEYADYQNNEVSTARRKVSDMRPAAAGTTKHKKETLKKEEEEEEKTLAQQVADGKYGLIQHELFANGSRRPGILSYQTNPEVPRDTKATLGGLDKEDIWLAEDHLLVLRGGRLGNDTASSSWPPIDDYQAPPRQVKIPDKPKIPPPFPIQLTEDGPVEFVRGENGTGGPPPLPFGPGGFPPYPLPPPNGSLPFPSFPLPPPDQLLNGTFPFPPGPLPPFLANLPPGAAFLPPPGNFTDFDEDDPSIYYPPKYDFYYPQDNTTAVPPGPLVPGIILPPPPDFFAPLDNRTRGERPRDQDNETDEEDNHIPSRKPPYVAPAYLPAAPHSRKPHKRPPISNHIPGSSPPPGVTYVYPEHTLKPTAEPPAHRPVYRVPSEAKTKFASPIYVPNTGEQVTYHPLPTTSPKPNHITVPSTKTLPQEIYIVTTPGGDLAEKNVIKDIYKEPKLRKHKLEELRPEVHPLRSLIKPNVSVSYIGKYGHLPASTPFPFPKRQPEATEGYHKPLRGGHYITKAPPPDVRDNVITQGPLPEVSLVTVTPVPIVKKIRLRPVLPDTTPSTPTKATFYFYEEMPKNPSSEAPLRQAEVLDEQSQPPQPPRAYNSELAPQLPVRQFLEETFHASNVLPNKPPPTHANTVFSGEAPKMKHLYGAPVRPSPVVKYHYITEEDPVMIPKSKIKVLEVENSGVSGVHQPKATTTTPAPGRVPEKLHTLTLSHPTTTPSPFLYRNTDGPFVPSNYYATVRPNDLHFTQQDHSMIDDITKNYFTIFGQKINSGATTPLIPAAPAAPTKAPSSGLSYVSDSEFQIKQVHSTPQPYTTERPKYVQIVTPTPRPQSSFEQYLKELTGEDQNDFILAGVGKTKKGKANFAVQLPQGYLRQQGLSQYLQEVRPPRPPPPPYEGYVQRPKLQYRPNYSTTLRPVMNVEIQPQYVQHVSSTYRPFPSQIRNHNLGQFLHEISSFTSPTTINPVKIKGPVSNLQYFPSTAPPARNVFPQQQHFTEPEVKPAVSLEGDILVNYKPPRPEINPEAELIDVRNPPPFEPSSNFRVVQPPDLSGKPYRRPHLPPRSVDPAKDFFESLPNSGYFAPAHQSSGNSFISYNLPGNGGHFYFLTPQVADRSDGGQEQVKRRRSDEQGQRVEDQRRPDLSSPDYLRRRRKKP